MPNGIACVPNQNAAKVVFASTLLGVSGRGHAGRLQRARAAGAVTWVQSLEPPSNLEAGDRYRAGRAAEVVPGLLRELAAAIEVASP